MPKQTTFVIGSINGRADLINAALHEINIYATQNMVANPTVVLLGDFIDHGPDAKGVLDILMTNRFDFDLVPLRGDHEDRFLDIFAHDGEASATHNAYVRWIANGGMATVQSFLRARTSSAPLAAAPDQVLCQLIDDRYSDWLADLRTSFSDDVHFFSHAGINPALSLEDQGYDDLIYGVEGGNTAQGGDFEQILVHTTALKDEEVLVHPNRITVATPARRRDAARISILLLELGQPARTITAVLPTAQAKPAYREGQSSATLNQSLTRLP